MPEYRIETDASTKRHEMRIRLLSWGTVLLLIAITVLIFALRFLGLLAADSDLRYLAVLAMLGAVAGATILAFREGLRLAEREMVFVLDHNGIVRRREGFPDVRIAFSEISALTDEMRWLVIYSVEPRRKIAVPNDVRGFEVIRSELAKHHALFSAQAKPPMKGAALTIMSILSWAAVLWFRDPRAVIAAAAIALTLLALGSHRLWTLLRRGQNQWLAILYLGIAWFTAILLIYIRLWANKPL